MFLGRKSQYGKMTILPNTVYRLNPYQNTNDTFHRTRTKIFTVHVETQKTWIAKGILSKKNGAEGINLSDFILYYKVSHQDSMVLRQKQKYRPKEQNRKPRNKPMHLWAPYFWQRKQEYKTGQRQLLQ